jgi:hypothetical protein
MKPGDSGLDDLLNEALYVLDRDGGRLARVVRWVFVRAYRALKTAMLLVLRWNWRRQPYPDPGCDPFNLTDTELEQEWGQR